MKLNGDALIRLPLVHSKDNYLAGFWQWVAMMESGDYDRAIAALYWPRSLWRLKPSATWTPVKLRDRVTSFFGGDRPWSVVIPNDRLIGVINAACECVLPGGNRGEGWFMSQIPLTNEPENPKDDGLPLMGLATSFFVRRFQNSLVLAHEIFHV